MFYKTNVLDTYCTCKQDVIVVIKKLENDKKMWNIIQNFYLKLKKDDRRKSNSTYRQQ
jgi:hypothetical protein